MACRIMPERLKLLVAALETSVSCVVTGSQVIQGDTLCDIVSKALKAPLEKYSLKPLKARSPADKAKYTRAVRK